MARIIKGRGQAQIVPRVAYDARVEARALLGQAEAQAATLLQQAELQAAALLTSARQAAAVEAVEAARRAETRALEQVAELLTSATRLRDNALAVAEPELQSLALALAAKLLRSELSLAPERVSAIVRDALARTKRARHVTLRVHPSNAAAVEALLNELCGAQASDVRPRVEVTASVTPGGCVVVTELGTVDAQIETQLQVIAEALGWSGATTTPRHGP